MAAVLAVLALAAAAVAVWPSPKPAVAASAPANAPVLDAARLPQFLSQTVANVRLAQRLDPLASRDQSCLVVEDANGPELYSRRPAQSLLPASNLKLLTTAAALHRMGENERYRTEVRAERPAVNGVVNGDLFLVGAGDPLLATADFAAQAGYQHQPRGRTPIDDLAAKLTAAGIRQVQGRIVGDESRYDTRRTVPSWSPSYTSTFEIGPMSALTVNDNFAAWAPQVVPAPSPSANAAAVLTRLLQEKGVTVTGGAGDGRAPAGATTVVAATESAPMTEVVAQTLTQSDNLAAELITKELGRRFGGGGSTDNGINVVNAALRDKGLPTDGVLMVDGSGLDRQDRATCQLLLGILRQDGPTGPIARGLPVAGSTGTLFHRLGGTAAAGRVRAKTGTLSGAASFSGWAAANKGRQLAFSYLVNGIASEAEGRALEDRLALALVAYPEAPPPEALTGST